MKKFLPFHKAKKFVQNLNLKNVKEWILYTKSPEFPEFLPKHPSERYKKSWKSFKDFLGVKPKFVSYNKARKLMKSLKIKSQTHYITTLRDLKLPLPQCPNLHYKESWKGWREFLEKS